MKSPTTTTDEYLANIESIAEEVHHLLEEIELIECDAQRIHDELQNYNQSQSQNTVDSKQALFCRHLNQTTFQTLELPPLLKESCALLDKLEEEKLLLMARIAEISRRATWKLKIAIDSDAWTAKDVDIHAVTIEEATAYAATMNETLDAYWQAGEPENENQIPLSSPTKTVISVASTKTKSSLKRPPLKKRRFNCMTPSSPPRPPPATRSSSSGLSSLTPMPSSSPCKPQFKLKIPGTSKRDTKLASANSDNNITLKMEIDDYDNYPHSYSGAPSTGLMDPEDPTLYCYCQATTYGEMVGCDNEECPYEWFHRACAGIQGDLPDSWYCTRCTSTMVEEIGKAKKERRPSLRAV